MKIRRAEISDAAAIVELYNWYIVNTSITFETEPISVEEMKMRMEEKLDNYDWLVAEIDDVLVGYAYYGSFRSRAAYQHTVESTIYLSREFKGQGIGSRLYKELIDSAKNKKYREMLAVIAIPNPESISFHKKMGFLEVGVMKKIGYKFNCYVDVSFLQKSLCDDLMEEQ
ncbi:MAG: N-acetyltransferase family protein [Bacteroidota bacterium]|nr:N-acetyltransferase family protein [Bacteroidota bacterium]